MGTIRREKSGFSQWVVANSFGRVLGVIAFIVLASLEEVLHTGKGIYVGEGMGWGVGWALWLAAPAVEGATVFLANAAPYCSSTCWPATICGNLFLH